MQTTTSKDNTTIAFDKLGSGPALILVDGALCHRTFGPMPGLAPLLAEHFTVFMYDRRGRGDSGNTLPYSLEREIEDIDTLIGEAGGSACVYGISSGAALALEAAASGLNITRLALYEPPYNDSARQQFGEYRKGVETLLSEGERGDAVALFMGYVGTPDEAVAGMKQSPMWPALESVAPTLAYDAAALGDGAVPVERAAAVKVPALVMAGGASFPFMHETAQALASAIPNAEYRSLAGQTHDVAAEAIAPELIAFFNG